MNTFDYYQVSFSQSFWFVFFFFLFYHLNHYWCVLKNPCVCAIWIFCYYFSYFSSFPPKKKGKKILINKTFRMNFVVFFFFDPFNPFFQCFNRIEWITKSFSVYFRFKCMKNRNFNRIAESHGRREWDELGFFLIQLVNQRIERPPPPLRQQHSEIAFQWQCIVVPWQ